MTQERLRILIAYSTRYPTVTGGVDTMIVSLVNQLRHAHDVMLFAAGRAEETDLSCSTVNGIKTYAMYLRLLYYGRFSIRNFIAWLFEFPRSLFRLRRLVRDERIDVIHLHMLNRYFLVFVVLRLLGGPPYIVTLHGSDTARFTEQGRVTQMIGRCILRYATRVVAVSQWLAHRAKAVFPFVPNVVAVPNGVDIFIPPDIPREELERAVEHHIPKKYFTMIAALEKYKAQDVAIGAWARLKTEFPDVHLIIVGSGSLEQEYRSLIESTKCADTVHLSGRLPHDTVMSLASEGLGVIFPSRNEGMGYVVLETGLLGLPIVCSDIGPFLEIVTDRENALIVPVNDSDALKAAVGELVLNPDLGSKLGAALKAVVQQRYSSNHMADQYASLYGDAVATTEAKDELTAKAGN